MLEANMRKVSDSLNSTVRLAAEFGDECKYRAKRKSFTCVNMLIMHTIDDLSYVFYCSIKRFKALHQSGGKAVRN